MNQQELETLRNCAAVLHMAERRERGQFYLSTPTFLVVVTAALDRARTILRDYEI